MYKVMRCAAGNPSCAPGTMVSIEGMGKTFSGDYYVTSVVHTHHAEMWDIRHALACNGVRFNADVSWTSSLN